MANIVAVEVIATKIFEVRGKNVMLDAELAKLYGVATKNLNKAVKRNMERFPDDFMYQLTKEEVINLRFQFGTSSYGGRRYLPYVFTQEEEEVLSGRASFLTSQLFQSCYFSCLLGNFIYLTIIGHMVYFN